MTAAGIDDAPAARVSARRAGPTSIETAGAPCSTGARRRSWIAREARREQQQWKRTRHEARAARRASTRRPTDPRRRARLWRCGARARSARRQRVALRCASDAAKLRETESGARSRRCAAPPGLASGCPRTQLAPAPSAARPHRRAEPAREGCERARTASRPSRHRSPEPRRDDEKPALWRDGETRHEPRLADARSPRTITTRPRRRSMHVGPTPRTAAAPRRVRRAGHRGHERSSRRARGTWRPAAPCP